MHLATHSSTGRGTCPRIILVGTMTGTAELCAEEMCDALEGAGHSAEMILMDDLEANIFDPAAAHIICTSTYGHGCPGQREEALQSLQSARPNLEGVRYGVFALGDITHGETFCWGGINFDKVMSGLSATRVGEIVKHDATSGTPEDMAGEWAAEWVKQLRLTGFVTAW